MTTRHINNNWELQQCSKFMGTLTPPFTVTIAKGKKRSDKLHMGVPILREENEAFRLIYDEFIKPHPYEKKLKLMEGDTFAVTRLMTSKQKTRYLDDVFRHWSEQGMILTLPE